MNERVKELAEQCQHQYSEHRIDLEKFAELIVRECIEQLRLVPYGSDTIEFGEEVPYQDAIKKHFGVEE